MQGKQLLTKSHRCSSGTFLLGRAAKTQTTQWQAPPITTFSKLITHTFPQEGLLDEPQAICLPWRLAQGNSQTNYDWAMTPKKL